MAAFTLSNTPLAAVAFGRSGYNKDGDDDDANRGRSGYNRNGGDDNDEPKNRGRSGYNKDDDEDEK